MQIFTGDVPFRRRSGSRYGASCLSIQVNKENTGISNFAGMYKVINQINLMIAKTKETTVLSEAGKNYYLGEAYGMRAYLYFHLLRSWGDVILYLDYTNGASFGFKQSIESSFSCGGGDETNQRRHYSVKEKGFSSDYSFV
ncbi:RagB/SusD family nutrient uptake outer membrane protein [Bacteroides fragilis]|nr:RagB/SusD family nutrient uptake outer membrane protein [Bacteroides fragilis]